MVKCTHILITIIFLTYFDSLTSKCTNEPYGLHCSNIVTNDSRLTTIETEKDENITSIFLRNVSGVIDNSTFKYFSKLEHLDIQFSIIKNFSANLTDLKSLYLIKNIQFPNITSEFFDKCYCKNLTMLIIIGNTNLNITKDSCLPSMAEALPLWTDTPIVCKSHMFFYFRSTCSDNFNVILTSNTASSNDNMPKKERSSKLGTVFLISSFSTDEADTAIQGAFKHVQSLRHLTINHQNIINLSKLHFEGLKELTYLDLKGNSIQTIEEDTFEDLPNLNYLILSDNKITKFEENTFKNLNNLQSLEVLNLNIISFNKNTFKNQKSLRLLGIPTKWIKEGITLRNLTNTFTSLETIELLLENQNDKDVQKFIKTCKYGGFITKLVE